MSFSIIPQNSVSIFHSPQVSKQQTLSQEIIHLLTTSIEPVEEKFKKASKKLLEAIKQDPELFHKMQKAQEPKTVIGLAAKFGLYDLVKWLIEQEAQNLPPNELITSQDSSYHLSEIEARQSLIRPLHLSIFNGHKEIFILLLEKHGTNIPWKIGHRVNVDCLSMALEKEHLDICLYLLKEVILESNPLFQDKEAYKILLFQSYEKFIKKKSPLEILFLIADKQIRVFETELNEMYVVSYLIDPFLRHHHYEPVEVIFEKLLNFKHISANKNTKKIYEALLNHYVSINGDEERLQMDKIFEKFIDSFAARGLFLWSEIKDPKSAIGKGSPLAIFYKVFNKRVLPQIKTQKDYTKAYRLRQLDKAFVDHCLPMSWFNEKIFNEALTSFCQKIRAELQHMSPVLDSSNLHFLKEKLLQEKKAFSITKDHLHLLFNLNYSKAQESEIFHFEAFLIWALKNDLDFRKDSFTYLESLDPSTLFFLQFRSDDLIDSAINYYEQHELLNYLFDISLNKNNFIIFRLIERGLLDTTTPYLSKALEAKASLVSKALIQNNISLNTLHQAYLPFHFAIFAQDSDCFFALLQKNKGLINFPVGNSTPLHLALKHFPENIIEDCLSYCSDTICWPEESYHLFLASITELGYTRLLSHPLLNPLLEGFIQSQNFILEKAFMDMYEMSLNEKTTQGHQELINLLISKRFHLDFSDNREDEIKSRYQTHIIPMLLLMTKEIDYFPILALLIRQKHFILSEESIVEALFDTRHDFLIELLLDEACLFFEETFNPLSEGFNEENIDRIGSFLKKSLSFSENQNLRAKSKDFLEKHIKVLPDKEVTKLLLSFINSHLLTKEVVASDNYKSGEVLFGFLLTLVEERFLNIFDTLKQQDPLFYLKIRSTPLMSWVINYFSKEKAIEYLFREALIQGNPYIVEQLIQENYCINSTPYLLEMANNRFLSLEDRLKLSLILIEKGENLFKKDAKGNLFLHLAIKEGQGFYEAVKAVLMKAPAQLYHPNNFTIRPIDQIFLPKQGLNSSIDYSEETFCECLNLSPPKKEDYLLKINNKSLLQFLIGEGLINCLPKDLKTLMTPSNEHDLNLLEEALICVADKVIPGMSIKLEPLDILKKIFNETPLRLRTDEELQDFPAIALIYKEKIHPFIPILLIIFPLIKNYSFPFFLQSRYLNQILSNIQEPQVINRAFLTLAKNPYPAVFDPIAKIGRYDYTPFAESLKQLIKAHLSQHKNSDDHPLKSAVMHENTSLINFYLTHFGYTELAKTKGTKQALVLAIKEGLFSSVKCLTEWLLQSRNLKFFKEKSALKQENIFHFAGQSSHNKILEYLLQTLPEELVSELINEKELIAENTPLLIYIKQSQFHSSELLILFKRKGANFSIKNIFNKEPLNWLLSSPFHHPLIQEQIIARIQQFSLFKELSQDDLREHLPWIESFFSLKKEKVNSLDIHKIFCDEKKGENPIELLLLLNAVISLDPVTKMPRSKFATLNDFILNFRMINQTITSGKEFDVALSLNLDLLRKYKFHPELISTLNSHLGLVLSKNHLKFIEDLDKDLPDVSSINLERALQLFDAVVTEHFVSCVVQDKIVVCTRDSLRTDLETLISRIDQKLSYLGTPKLSLPPEPREWEAHLSFYEIKQKLFKQFIYLLEKEGKETNAFLQKSHQRTHLIELAIAAKFCATRTKEELLSRRNEMLIQDKAYDPISSFYKELFDLRSQILSREVEILDKKSHQQQNVHNRGKIIHSFGAFFGVALKATETLDPTVTPFTQQEMLEIRFRIAFQYNPLYLILKYAQAAVEEDSPFHYLMIENQTDKEISLFDAPSDENEVDLSQSRFYKTQTVASILEKSGVILCQQNMRKDKNLLDHLRLSLYVYFIKPNERTKKHVEEYLKIMSDFIPFREKFSFCISSIKTLTLKDLLALNEQSFIENFYKLDEKQGKRKRLEPEDLPAPKKLEQEPSFQKEPSLSEVKEIVRRSQIEFKEKGFLDNDPKGNLYALRTWLSNFAIQSYSESVKQEVMNLILDIDNLIEETSLVTS